MIKAVGFDVGHTLIRYKNPLNWQSLYRPALEQVAQACNIAMSEEMASAAVNVLLKYNTRVNYRETEVTSDTIFGEILKAWDIQAESEMIKAEFYGFFKVDAQPFPEAADTLSGLKQRGIKTGILTDVAYGMDNKFSLQDVALLRNFIDIALTSVDVGFRKPNSAGFLKLLEYFDICPEEMLYVGDEEKDIIGANKLGIGSVLINRGGEVKEFGQNYTIKTLRDILIIVEGLFVS